MTRSQAELAGRRSRGQLDVRVAADGHGPSGLCRRDNGQTGRMQPVFSQEPPRALGAPACQSQEQGDGYRYLEELKSSILHPEHSLS